MYSNADMVKELVFLVENNTDITDAEIRTFGRRAESLINQWLGNRYIVPIVPSDDSGYPTGTISTVATTTAITGVGTTFTSDTKAGDVIYVTDTDEAIRIGSVTDATNSVSDFNAVNTATGSTYFVIPAEVVTVSEYLTAHLLIITHFSEQAYNQQTNTWNSQFKTFAEPLLKQIEAGDYYNRTIKEQVIASTIRRQGEVFTGSLRTQVDSDSAVFYTKEFI